MRLFLLPISTRRSLIYCERIQQPGTSRSIIDKATTKASEKWTQWEKSNIKWQKALTEYGNKVLRRIPFEEWSLKTVPPLSDKWRKLGLEGKGQVELLYPPSFFKESGVSDTIKTLAIDRQPLHRKRLIWSIIGMPITAPIAIIPVIPNIPFFYLVFRAYSHWKALSGAKHLEFLLKNNLIKPTQSEILDELYATGLKHQSREASRNAPATTDKQTETISQLIEKQTNNEKEEVMVLKQWNGKLLAEGFKLPEMEIELERAVEQVEETIADKDTLNRKKKDIEVAMANSDAKMTEKKKEN